MKAHEELKKLLFSKNTQSFVKDLCFHAYPWTEKIPVQYLEYKIFEEFRLRQGTGEKTQLGLDKKLQLIPDIVLFIKPGYRALNQQHCFTVALEIKEFKDDLMYDEKLWKYIGWTDFFFIAVPDDLTDYALKKVDEVNEEHPECKERIGILGLETGIMYNCPKRSDVPIEKQNLVLQNAVYNYAFKDAQTIYFSPETGVTGLQENEAVPQSLTIDKQNEKIEVNQSKRQLSDEEKSARKAAAIARQEYREKRAEVLSEKASVLPEETRQRLSSLPQKTQEVFWTIRESEDGDKQKDIAEKLGYSERTTSSCLSSLVSSGLVERQGSKKTGAYHVSSVAACNTTCATCSIALQCKDYQPVK